MKYKINNNDKMTNVTSNKIVKENQQQTIKTATNAKYLINVKANKKKRILLFSLYLLAFGATTTTTVLLLHSNTTFNDSQFNPNANNKLWADYYKHHHHDAAPINLKSTKLIEYFNNTKNVINCDVSTSNKVNGDLNLDFLDVLNSIDSNLQKAGIENNIDNDKSPLLPINFFANVNYNPAVKFTVGEQKAPITSTSFPIPKGYNETNSYRLNFTTNEQAPMFGINDTNINIQININIKNQIAVNISDLPFNFTKKIINIPNPKQATINSIKDKWLIPDLKTHIAEMLGEALHEPSSQIKTTYYQIAFSDGETLKDFTNNVAVAFSITALDNPWKFTGTKNCHIDVQNDIINLSTMTDLTKQIEAKYNTKEANKDLQIDLENKQDEKGNYINADVSLSADDLNDVNKKIANAVKDICQTYFNDKYSDFNIKYSDNDNDSDYSISTNLQVGDNIFKNDNQLGKQIAITITANPNSHKLANSLTAVQAIVHGHNNHDITNTYTSPAKFALDGIWLKDGQDRDRLQEGHHFYEQKKLLANWVTDQNSLLNSVINNCYQPIANSFTGHFTMHYQLDEKNNGSMKADISKDITGGKATNFWNLITSTKNIFLETNVSSDWSVNEVKLVFTNNENQPTKDNILYTFDLSSQFNGISVTPNAHLTFPDFNFSFSYQLKS